MTMKSEKRPAIVRYLGGEEEGFTVGKKYEAFFAYYWSGTRDSLHVRNDRGEISDWHKLENFEILDDPDGILEGESVYDCGGNLGEAK